MYAGNPGAAPDQMMNAVAGLQQGNGARRFRRYW